jgi:hypothetical protein
MCPQFDSVSYLMKVQSCCDGRTYLRISDIHNRMQNIRKRKNVSESCKYIHFYIVYSVVSFPIVCPLNLNKDKSLDRQFVHRVVVIGFINRTLSLLSLPSPGTYYFHSLFWRLQYEVVVFFSCFINDTGFL